MRPSPQTPSGAVVGSDDEEDEEDAEDAEDAEMDEEDGFEVAPVSSLVVDVAPSPGSWKQPAIRAQTSTKAPRHPSSTGR